MTQARATTCRPRRAEVWIALLLVLAGAGCRTAAAPVPIQRLVIASGQSGGVFYPLGQALARNYAAAIPGLRVIAEPTVGSVFNVRQLQLGKADLAFTQSDSAYLSYQQPADPAQPPYHKLRGIAVLNVNILHILGRGPLVRTVEDLRGRHVGLGATGSGTEVAARIVVEGHRLRYADLKAEFLPFSDVASRLRGGTLDGGFVAASYPAAAITAATASPDVHLMPITREAVRRIRAHTPSSSRRSFLAALMRGRTPTSRRSAWTTCWCAVRTSARSWSTSSPRRSSPRCRSWRVPTPRRC